MPDKALPPDKLYTRCDPAKLGFETTREVEEFTDTLGQERAVEALRFGVGIRREGYNLFAFGPPHTGKYSVIRTLLDARAAEMQAPPDWCYVNNFDAAHRPRALRLPPGTGVKLRAQMERLVDDLKSTIPTAFESDEYRARRQVIDQEFKERQESAFEELQKQATEKSVALIRTPTGLALAPTYEGDVIRPDVFEKLPEEQRATIEHDMEELQKQLQEAMRLLPQWEKERRDKVRELSREVTSFVVAHVMDALRAEFSELGEVIEYLNAVEHDIIENFDSFVERREEAPVLIPGLPIPQGQGEGAYLRRYRVNVIVDNSSREGAPVVFEDHPTQPNLVGRAEHVAEMGTLITDFGLIKPGALHRANGGYLVLDARKLLTQPFSWDALKRALRSREMRVESPGQMLSIVSTVSLEPEPIPLDLKVVLIGERLLYYLLCQYDPEFEDLFKVAVDFEEDMDRDAGATRNYARLIATLARKSELHPFDAAGVARVIEHSARLAGDAEKLSAQVDRIHDLLREADYWAGEGGREVVTERDVQAAIDAQIRRADRLRERGLEAITRGTILIDSEGERVGQVNGLSVISLGNYAFGRPTRITARVRLGRGEVVDIERKVELGGPLHSKGVFILEGFLGARFAVDRPLSLSASLVFEQSYGGVDGDSASSTELYALLSALAQAPIKQSFAVTGSVNQHGEVQAIGGVNEKIEGFFDVCKARGLSGEQGVLIPISNVKHLMLRQDVIEAVESGQFRIFPVETIDQGIEILTATPAGERAGDGLFPEGTINRRVEDRLIALAEKRRSFGRPEKGDDDGEDGQ
jgi:lon-related putative ATP-dependent protease